MATSFHARSNSFPSRHHPISSQIEENLNRLRSSQSASVSSSSIGQKLNGLQDLHECLCMLLQLPLTQQSLSQEQQKKCVEELLDGSLMVLDVCNTAKDGLLQIRECTQQIQSVLRRRRDVEGLTTKVGKYLNSRKTVKKAILKVLKNLKDVEIKHFTNNRDLISTLRRVEAETVNVLESILSFISGPEAESKLNRWFLVSKLMKQKKVTCEEEEQIANEIANAEATLCSFLKSGNIKYVESVQNELLNSEMCIQDLEEQVESLYRHLIKARVIILNILNC